MRDSSKFFLKFILAILPLIIWCLFTYFCPLAYMDEQYPSWHYVRSVIYDSSVSYDTVILGDSTAKSSLNPTLLSDSTVSLALGGTTPIEMYYTAKTYLERHTAPKHVIVQFSPFHYSYVDNYDNRTRYFHYLTIPQAYELYQNAAIAQSESIQTENAFVEELSCRLGLPTKYLPALINSRFIGRLSTNRELLAKCHETRGYDTFGTADGCDALNYETNYLTMPYEGDAVLIRIYMDKLMALLAEYDLDVYITQSPMSCASMNAIHKEYLSEYNDYLNDVVKGYDNVTLSTEIAEYPNALYGDSQHMNQKGGDVFSLDYKAKFPELFE